MSALAADRRLTLADAIARPALLTSTVFILAGAAVTALLAQVSIPLPFTPVPITLQTMGSLLVGSALGSRRGALSLLVYALAGMVFPIYAGGVGGAAHLLGATGGYILGFIIAAWAAGRLAEAGWDRKWQVILAMIIADAIIFVAGMAWLTPFVGIANVAMAGLIPFIPGEVVKIAAASGVLPLAWKAVGRRHH